MNNESCIQTIELLRQLALNIHGVIDVVDNRNCNDIINLLKEQEAVVHCGDCENFCFDNISPNAGRCMLTNMSHSKTWFCAHGKREEGR